MQVKDLKPNKKNPRKITDQKLQALKKSVEKFGDLGCIVYNRQTKTLIAGHQRTKTIPPNTTVHIDKRYDTPTDSMTVAVGHIEIEGERFNYREVDASPEWEVEALLAANKHGGEWDIDLLKLNLADFPSLDLELSGFDRMELKGMNIDFNPDFQIGPTVNSEKEQTDEQYLQSEKGKHDQEAERERLPSLINREPSDPSVPEPITDVDPLSVFDKVEEKTDIVGKRFIIIIDCLSDIHKSELKEKLLTIVNESGAKFF